ncbi:MAG: cyclase family protein [Saprospiraceae bacterium]|nr:cyclase family protein [Saprospiraceae bacterium]
MIISFSFSNKQYISDLSFGLDISIPLISGSNGPKCFHAPSFNIEPVVMGDFIGSTQAGSAVNFKNIFINPHGNGTHTECVGHITSEPFTIHSVLKKFHYISRLITIVPDKISNGDLVINEKSIHHSLQNLTPTETIIIRTMPNETSKKEQDYSGTNPPYFTEGAIKLLNEIGVLHLITDLPSIDKEEDGGILIGHKTFWGLPDRIMSEKTITEMAYIDNVINDGLYLCNFHILSIESDASPSKIVLYRMEITK